MEKQEINKKSLFKIAHAIKRNDNVKSFMEALTLAWKAMRLQAKLMLGETTFSYLKTNGEVRTAKGTLKGMINESNPGFRNGAENILYYLDLEKKGFRSFDAARIVSIL